MNMAISPYLFIVMICFYYLIVFVAKRLLFPTFSIFFSKSFKQLKKDNGIIYMFLIYILLIFVYTFTSTPILDTILKETNVNHIEISLLFGILFAGLLRVVAAQYYYKEVAFIIYSQIIFSSLSLIIFFSYFYKDCNYFLRIHNQFLTMIENGYFINIMFPLTIILFVFIEFVLKVSPPFKNNAKTQ